MFMGHLAALLFFVLYAPMKRKNDGPTTRDQHALRLFWQ